MNDPEVVLAELGAEGPDVAPALRPATTFRSSDEGWSYRRSDHPGLPAIETAAARLDDGAAAMAFSSGMGAIVTLLETLPPGARVVAPAVCYHGTREWLRHLAATGRVSLALVDGTDPDRWEAAVAPGTAIVWAEPIVNPTWDVLDLRALAGLAHAAGGRLAVDATATPLTTRPIDHGADVVVHSGSKAYNGHSDVHAGFVVTAAAGPWWDGLHRLRSLMGTILQPWDAWLLARGMRTMALRVDRATASATDLAARLAGHPAVERVRYPGLANHPGHAVAAGQMDRGFGTMLSIDVADWEAASAVVDAVEVWTPATSLGGVESLIEHRATVEPPGSPVPLGLLRLSVGIEAVEVLWEDLDRALSNLP